MKRQSISCLILALFVLSTSLLAYEASGGGKYEALVGEYEFEYQGQVMVITFKEEAGKLLAAPQGEEFIEVDPVEGEDMMFDVTTPQGQYYEILFAKDESGKVNLCTLITMSLEIEGVRVNE